MRESGRPPSSRPSDAQLARLETTRGAVRDALSAIRNLHELLRSIRMAPKAVGEVIPEVRAAARSLVGFTRELLDAVGAHLDDSTCLHDLVDHMTPPVADLEEALSLAMSTAMSARTRLDLERAVERSATEIECALALVSLLEDAVSAHHTVVSTRDLIRESLFGASSNRGKSADVVVDGPSEDLEIIANTRAAMGLVSIAAALVSSTSERPAAVSWRGSGATVEIAVVPFDGTGSVQTATVPRLIGPSQPCARAVARAIGVTMEVGDDGRRVALQFPASP